MNRSAPTNSPNRVKAFFTRHFRNRRQTTVASDDGDAATATNASNSGNMHAAATNADADAHPQQTQSSQTLQPQPSRLFKLFSRRRTNLRRTDPPHPNNRKRGRNIFKAGSSAGAAGSASGSPMSDESGSPASRTNEAQKPGDVTAVREVAEAGAGGVAVGGARASANASANANANANAGGETDVEGESSGDETFATAIELRDSRLALPMPSYHGLADSESDLGSQDFLDAHREASLAAGALHALGMPAFEDPRRAMPEARE